MSYLPSLKYDVYKELHFHVRLLASIFACTGGKSIENHSPFAFYSKAAPSSKLAFFPLSRVDAPPGPYTDYSARIGGGILPSTIAFSRRWNAARSYT